MAQLMLVDDEAHVVDRFATTIDWKSVSIEGVYRAYSAAEALELLEQYSIDIVITDIKMPGMSGLQLIAEIRRLWPKTKCILLSGYSDFDFAKQAILYQTEDYLLKPVKEDDLLSTVKRVLLKLEQEWEEVVSSQRMTYTLKENLPLLRANLLHELLQGKKWSAEVLQEKMNRLEMGSPVWESFALMVIRMDEPFLQYELEDQSWKEYAVSNMVEELFGARYAIWYAKDAHDYLVFLLTAKQEDGAVDDPIWFERTAAALQSAVCAYLKAKISILVSKRGIFPEDVASYYNRSIASFRKRIGNERELFMRLEDEDKSAAPIHSLQSLYEPPTLIHLLEAARWDVIEEKLQRIYETMENGDAVSQEHLLEVYFTIASAYTFIAHKNGRRLADLIGSYYDRMSEGFPCRSLNHLREWSFRTLQHMREDMDRETQDSRSALIRDIQTFVEENVTRDISLQTIAEKVVLHPVYVSKVYKLETGENISDYVQRVKMKKAEHMLKLTNEKIYEIATQLGYQRPHSFIYAFKKMFGITPQEYRDRYLT
ncbi:response regulator transcription factor [Paenibacillus harenae]|uniref:Two-component system response regulator YesN n=1 Tax=Paenibacillus harenae TaxID=306543 RepID=A0ABT9U7J1_PAEHA|nr:response regulator [Paenibacillus harenae]MDQ0114189.1 two-component system response regulator YesN [Paenibacillus harenae]